MHIRKWSEYKRWNKTECALTHPLVTVLHGDELEENGRSVSGGQLGSAAVGECVACQAEWF